MDFKKEDLIKYGLMAVGAFLLWKWLTQPGGLFAADQSAAAQVPGETAKPFIAEAKPAPAPAKPAPAPVVAAPVVKTQAEIDKIEYQAGVDEVKRVTQGRYSAGQLDVIDKWLYSAATQFQAKNGNMNGFNSWVILNLPAYLSALPSAMVWDQQYQLTRDLPAVYDTSYRVKGGDTTRTSFVSPIYDSPPLVTAAPNEATLMAAALDSSKAGITGPYKLSGHLWNWYRMQAAIAAGIYDQAKHAPNIEGLDSDYTAAEYHALLAKSGLSGMGMGWGAPAGAATWMN